MKRFSTSNAQRARWLEHFEPAAFAGDDGQFYGVEVDVVFRRLHRGKSIYFIEKDKETAIDMTPERPKMLDG